MKKKNTSYIHPYPHFKFNRDFANKWNDMCYDTWLIMDEGQERPDPQRLTNFLCKYARKNKKTGKSIASYIPKDYWELIVKWVRMTQSERKQILQLSPDAGDKVRHWLTQAQDYYFYDLSNKN